MRTPAITPGRRCASLILLACLGPACRAAPTFEKDVLPILSAHCFDCHGGLKQRGGLDLRTIGAIKKGGKSGPAVKAGAAKDSLLWQKVSKDAMPKALIKLSAAEKRTIEEWADAGTPRAASWLPGPYSPLEKAAAPAKVAGAIDALIEARLKAEKVEPAALSDDAEFLRRVTLDLTGRLPRPDRVRAFLGSKEADKRARLIDQLLASPDFGRHWGRVWHNALMPLDDGKRAYDEGLIDWLAKGLNDNRKWGEIASDLVTATGKADESPQVAFLAALKAPDKMSQRVAGVFLGINMECAECHNHPHTQWRQKDDYWAMAAFFSRVKVGTTRGKAKSSRVPTLTEARGKLEARIPRTALAAANAKVGAGFPGLGQKAGGPADPSRKALASWMTAPENPYFAAATANRVWGHFFGRGLVSPVNNLHDGSAATHPEALALLAGEFRCSGSDLKHLVRCVCLTRAYQRTSRAEKEAEAQEELYGRMAARVLAPDVFYDVLVQALEVPHITVPNSPPSGGKKAPRTVTPRELFVNTFRQAEGPTPREYDHGVLQVLQLLNWKEFNTGGGVVKRLLDARTPHEQAVEELYLRCLSRLPSEAEKGKALAYVKKRGGSREAFDSVLWALINSSEFVFNH